MTRPIKIDLGDLCTHCGRDTSFGSVDENGEKLLLFVNRIPSGADATLTLVCGNYDLETVEIPVTADGYMCPDCQCIECDECGELTLEYEFIDQEIPIHLCPDCMEKREVSI